MFDSPFYTTQLITYIGNKRTLLPFIDSAVKCVKAELGKDELVIMDGFSGSGVVARLLKNYASKLYANDMEAYSYIINKCYLSNKSELDLKYISNTSAILNRLPETAPKNGFIYDNYAPKDDNNIARGERAFYTKYNAIFLDTLKAYIYENIEPNYQPFFIAPLIVEASIHTNTSGVFKGFHKKNGVGCFGGAAENALSRIKQKMKLQVPIFSEKECPVSVSKRDINELVKDSSLPEFDLVYYDPPYNQHPYGSNYFMLNILATPDKSIPIQNGVSGIAEHWNRSAYNKKPVAIAAMDDLIKNTRSKYILLSYNNEGIIPFDLFKSILLKYGDVKLLKKDYNTYRGCRNLKDRNLKVRELLWILKKDK